MRATRWPATPIGDAAVDMALDAIEAAMNANPRPDPRHRIEHSVLNTDERPAAHQGSGRRDLHAAPGHPRISPMDWTRIWGEERTQRMIPTRTWLDMGVPLALSSDAPSMPWWDPQTTLFGSIVRVSPPRSPSAPSRR